MKMSGLMKHEADRFNDNSLLKSDFIAFDFNKSFGEKIFLTKFIMYTFKVFDCPS